MKRNGVIKTTLDNKHNEIIKSFKHNEEVFLYSEKAYKNGY